MRVPPALGLLAALIPASAVAQNIGPAFDCTKATAPLARLICSSPNLSRTDVQFSQAFWALRQLLPAERRQGLDEEDKEFLNSVLLACGIPESGSTAAGSPACVASHYNAQRARWAARLYGAAAEEASRAPEQHFFLQRHLQDLGYLPKNAVIDGVYGPATRAAIAGWQNDKGRATTAFLSDDDARALAAEPILAPTLGVASAGSAAPPSPPNSETAPSITARMNNEVPLKEQGGTYMVPVRINDQFALNFTIDSGASDVVIPADVMMTLMRTETLSVSDFIGQQTYTLADGSKLPSMTCNLRELSVGGHRLQSVRASVGNMMSGPLLGQSFLRRFRSWTMDNDRHVLVLVEH